MIKNAFKKITALFMALSVCFVLISLLSFEGFAADGISMRLDKLKKEFPSGYYYNHKVVKKSDKINNLSDQRDEKYSYSVTRYPCMDHDGNAEIGTYDCNYFDRGYQCHGFAAMLFYEIFGQRQSELERITKNKSSIKPGDLVRINNDTHSAIVLSVKGDSFTVAECNVGDGNESDSCKIRWGASRKLSDITYYVRAENYNKVSADSNWKNIEDKASLGSSFYAAISNGEKALTLSGDKVIFKKYSGAASQVWKFTKQKNGSYKIESCKNGLALEVAGAVKSGKAKLKAAKYSGAKSQLWAFYKNGKSYYLSADCGVSVLAVTDDYSACVDKKTTASSRLFKVSKKDTPEAAKLKAKASDGYVKLTWKNGKNTTKYDIKIYNASSKLYKKYKNLKNSELEVKLSAGAYSAEIISKNAYSKTKGNKVYFTVSKKGELGKVAKVTSSQTSSSITLSWTAVPNADAYAVFQKTGGEWKTVTVTEKTKVTFNKLHSGKKYTLAIKACKKNKDGNYTPSKDYISFTAATKLKKVSKLTASESTSSVTLKWPAMKNADGYRVYKKTSSGWEKVATVSAVKYTVKGLSSGKNYTFAVKPYMKTTLGTVWGELKKVSTATKPKAPKLTVTEVKKLKAAIRWDKVSGADGYQVYYRFENQDEYTHIANYKSTDAGVGLSKLSNGVTYIIAVRAYKKAGGKTIYSAFSEVKIKAKY